MSFADVKPCPDPRVCLAAPPTLVPSPGKKIRVFWRPNIPSVCWSCLLKTIPSWQDSHSAVPWSPQCRCWSPLLLRPSSPEILGCRSWSPYKTLCCRNQVELEGKCCWGCILHNIDQHTSVTKWRFTLDNTESSPVFTLNLWTFLQDQQPSLDIWPRLVQPFSFSIYQLYFCKIENFPLILLWLMSI